VQPPHGPHKIATNGQVVLPKDILAITGLRPGDAIYVQALEDPEGAVLIVPAAIATEWFEAGRQRSREEAAAAQ
jgi:AbrB family looped-hinge helix DNA binding protein